MGKISFKFLHRHIHKEKTFEKTHSHPCHEFVYYVCGCGTGNIESSSYEYGAGTWVYIPAKKKHSEFHETKTEVLFFAFDSTEMNLGIHEGLYCDEKEHVYEYFLKIEEEIKNKRPLYLDAVDLLLEQLVLEIRRTRLVSNDGKMSEECMQLAKSYIVAHIQQKITVREVAELVGYSYDYFRHQFLKCFAISPKDYIINERVSSAKKRLIDTDDSIAKIAERYSFDSPSHFTRIFKKKVGVSPLEYRITERKNRGNISVVYENSPETEGK